MDDAIQMHDVRVDSVTGLILPTHPKPDLAIKYYLERTSEAVRADIEQSNVTSLVAEVGKRIIGAVQMRLDSAREAYIMLLYVRTFDSGKGVGSHLLKAVESVAGAKGVERIGLLSTQLAVPFYEGKHKYENLGEGSFETTYDMRKFLPKKEQ